MTLDDVEHLSDKDDGRVTLFPVVFEHSVAKRIQKEVCMAETVVVNQDFLDQHSRVTDIFFLVRDEAVHVLIYFLDKSLKLLGADRRNIEEDQDKAFFFTVFHRVQSFKNFV